MRTCVDCFNRQVCRVYTTLHTLRNDDSLNVESGFGMLDYDPFCSDCTEQLLGEFEKIVAARCDFFREIPDPPIGKEVA